METINERIKLLRKSENLTQKEFAKRLLISQSYLSGLEKGNESPTSKLSKLICLEFGVNETWLFNGSGDMYDTVYENERSTLMDVSNSALLKILTLLSTSSNVEYGMYAYSIDFLASLLTQSAFLNENLKLEYLEHVQELLMDIDRMVHVATNNSLPALEQHKNGLWKDMNYLIECIEKMRSEKAED